MTHAGGTEIGEALREGRRRLGLDIKDVEERTKIRARYLRALENENWEVLPAPAYVRGFLRTYGQLLGLDGELLADEYRRRYEEAVPSGQPASEPVLTPRRGGRSPSRGLVIGGIVLAIVALLLVLGLFGGGGDDGGGEPAGGSGNGQSKGKQAQKQQRKKEKKAAKEAKPKPKRPEDAELTALTAVQVCLVGGKDLALIDDQVLQEGTVESFEGIKNYRLDFSAGSVRFVVGKSKERIEASEPVSFEGDSRGIRAVSYKGPECP